MGFSKKTKEQLKKIGVEFPVKGDAKELKKVLQAFIIDRKIDEEVVKSYLKNAGPSLNSLMDCLKKLSSDQAVTSQKVLDLIQNAIEICKKELEKDLDKDERKDVRDQIIQLVNEGRKESDEQRKLTKQLAMIAGGAVVIVSGVAIFALSRGKNTKVLQKGVEMVGKNANKLL